MGFAGYFLITWDFVAFFHSGGSRPAPADQLLRAIVSMLEIEPRCPLEYDCSLNAS